MTGPQQPGGLGIEALREALHYDPESGVITWAKTVGRRAKAGDVAGSPAHRGRLRIQINGRTYFAHRIAWALHFGAWPVNTIDHINQQPSDNRIANLRDVPMQINCQNRRKAQKNNSSGLLGVRRSRSRFVSMIHVEGQDKYLGSFGTAEQAHAAYVAAKRLFHPGCTL